MEYLEFLFRILEKQIKFALKILIFVIIYIRPISLVAVIFMSVKVLDQ